MKALKTVRLFAAASLFTVMAGAASADAAKPATVTPAAAHSGFVQAQSVVVLLGTASLEEYRQSDPANRTEITRATLAQRLAAQTPHVAGKAQS